MSALLDIEGLHAWYGASHVLHGVDLCDRRRRSLALSGRNGSGRSTLGKAIMGLVRSEGRVLWRGVSLDGLRPFSIARQGLGYVPEQRDIFPTLTVRRKPLARRARRAHAHFTIDDAYRLFPVLRRKGSA